MPGKGYSPVYQLTRGGIIESLHFGAAAIVDSNGKLLASIGDPQLVTFMRSSAKPFQATPFVENNGPDHFGLTQKELALTCASHTGTDDHAQTAQEIQKKAHFSENNLQCGVHPPTDRDTRHRLLKSGQAPNTNRHNCSGKHSGMLAFARMKGWPLENYLDPSHPIQLEILQVLSEMTGLPEEAIKIGIDGCSAPNFAIPLYNAALAFARLADPRDYPGSRAAACSRIVKAMTTHPDMIAGPGNFDTLLMEAAKGRLVSKGGAEGYQAIGLLPGTLGEGSPGIGIATKISDGSARKLASNAMSLEILRQLGFDLPTDKLTAFGPVVTLKNFKKLEIGKASPCFELER